jgi:hypothetical protein
MGFWAGAGEGAPIFRLADLVEACERGVLFFDTKGNPLQGAGHLGPPWQMMLIEFAFRDFVLFETPERPGQRWRVEGRLGLGCVYVRLEPVEAARALFGESYEERTSLAWRTALRDLIEDKESG